MNLRIRPFVNGAVNTFNDLPFSDDIGSVRLVADEGINYICVTASLYLNLQWLEFDGENIVAP